MKKWLPALGQVLLTVTAVVIAVIVGLHLWDYYMKAPWTRDGHVHADVVRVAPDVSGLVTELYIQDNQYIERGQPLFQIDKARFELAVSEAQALVHERKAEFAQAEREAVRNRSLAKLIATETVEIGDTRAKRAEAALATAQASLNLAKLNLERTLVLSPVTGYVSDQTMRVGDYVHTGNPVLSIIDSQTLRVEGYFEETKLERIAIGQPVHVQLMGDSRILKGTVKSLAAGIEDRDRTRGASLLPNIDPSFNWVRLAQRIPVRVVLDQTPDDMHMIIGRTATVSVQPWDHAAEPATP